MHDEAGGSRRLDPGVARFMAEVAAHYGRHPDFAGLPLARRREIAAATRARWNEGGPAMAATRELAVPHGRRPVPVRIHYPVLGAPLPVLVYVHGGGWTVFGLDTHDRLMREYAARASIAVVGVDYSLSPEAKFPTALTEIVAVVRWLREVGPGLGLDPGRLLVGGDSAGGNLTLAACKRLRDDGEADLVKGMVINYGALDTDLSRASYAAFDGPAYNLTRAEMEGFWANYLSPGTDRADPLAAPLNGDLAGLPPALVVIADCDVLADDNRELARRLGEAGGQVETLTVPGTVHSFLDAISISPAAESAHQTTARWIRRVVGDRGAAGMPYFAHSGTPGDKSDWQTLSSHLWAVASKAADFARPFGLERAGAAGGLFHDLGKYDPAFAPRLEGANVRVDHSTAGAAVLRSLAKGEDAVMAELLAYGILGHHAGLPDGNSADASCLRLRLERFRDKLDPVWRHELSFDLTGLMPERLTTAIRAGKHKAFDLSVVARFLFSCLVDADYRDTEAFYAARDGRQPDRNWPALQDLLPDLVARFDAHMAAKKDDTDVNRLRGDILAHVRAGAAMEPGLFTLTVPTGGGKTLASLGFALDHARLHGHTRIIYAIPFTSIIEQTADIFRYVLGAEHVLEHHSAIDEEAPDIKRRPTSRDRLKLAMEDWAAPVVVTTNVQFFESLFAARTSRARKLHNIAGSIIILDEAQTIPRHLLKPCVRMLDTLARLFGCTIVLCTATQPALGAPHFPDGLDLEGRELAPDPHDLARKLRRACIAFAGEMDNPALIAAIGKEPQALVIVNSRRHALDLYREAQAAGLDGLVHLTTRQCAAHRRVILADVRHRLKNGARCRVIATSLIEAGVDVDFPKVWRAEAGLDSIVQAAGRANREGKRLWEESVVTVFSAPDYKPPYEIVGLISDMNRMVRRHGDLLSPAATEDYFGEVYWRAKEKLDDKRIIGDFSLNRVGTDFAFRTVAEKFRMIESTLEPVIIRWDDKAKKVVEELAIEQIPSGVIARKLQRYIVQIPPQARALLIRNGHVAFEQPDFRGDQFAVLQTDSLYDETVGLRWEAPEYLAVEDVII